MGGGSVQLSVFSIPSRKLWRDPRPGGERTTEHIPSHFPFHKRSSINIAHRRCPLSEILAMPPIPAQTEGTRWTSATWCVCVVLLLASTLNYMDRQTLGNVQTRVEKEFKLTNEHYGNLVTYMRIRGFVPPSSER